jgi:phage terminase large subunit
MNRRERRAILHRYRRRPDLFAVEILGFHPWSKQVEILYSVRDNPRTAVRSCRGVGKTAIAAVVVLWFLYCYPNSRVVTTAPIFAQVKNLLWREIRGRWSAAALNGTPLGGTMNTTDLQVSEEWFAIGLSTNDPIAFQGHHAEHMLFVADEASGVSQDVYDAAEGFLTAEGARALLIGNGNLTSGQLYDAFGKEKAIWNCISISVFDSPNFTKEGEALPDYVLRRLVTRTFQETALRKWGENHPLYQVHVLGQFPSTADNTVFNLTDLEGAQAREWTQPVDDDGQPVGKKPLTVLSVDVARFGSDETVIGIRHGQRFRILKRLPKTKVTETVGHVIDEARKWDSEHDAAPIDYIVVDDAGVGGGVTDMLDDESDYEVRPFLGAGKPRDKKHFPNARCEAWFMLAEQITTVDLDDEPDLIADLIAPTWKLDKKGRRVVEPKEKTKERLGRSPDCADCCLMAFYPVRDTRGTAAAPTLYD